MIFENGKNIDKKVDEKFSFFDENEIIEINNDEDINNTTNYIYKNSLSIMNNFLNEFINEKSYKSLLSDNDNIKDDIFFFASFINSCKEYCNISDLLKDLDRVLKSNIDGEDFYYNIIYNYFENIFNIIQKDRFFEEERNISYLLNIMKKIQKYMKINSNKQFFEFKDIIINVERNILKILEKYINNKGIQDCIKILNILDKNLNKNEINNLEENKIHKGSFKISYNNKHINNKKNKDSEKPKIINNEKDLEEDKIIFHFDSYNKNSNTYHSNINNKNNSLKNKQKDNNSKQNKDNLEIYDNNKDYIDSFNNKENKKIKGNKKGNKNNKKEEVLNVDNNYNYENYMCPPIQSDDSD